MTNEYQKRKTKHIRIRDIPKLDKLEEHLIKTKIPYDND